MARSTLDAKPGLRLLSLAMALGAVTLVSACTSAQPTRTTITEQSTTRQDIPVAPPTMVTTTRTQQYSP